VDREIVEPCTMENQVGLEVNRSGANMVETSLFPCAWPEIADTRFRGSSWCCYRQPSIRTGDSSPLNKKER
jgi:hypothetical protein